MPEKYFFYVIRSLLNSKFLMGKLFRVSLQKRKIVLIRDKIRLYELTHAPYFFKIIFPVMKKPEAIAGLPPGTSKGWNDLRTRINDF